MDFLLFLDSKSEEILALVEKAGYRVSEDIRICRDMPRFFGALRKPQKNLVICTENIKRVTGYYMPRSNNDDHFKTRLHINQTLRHEAVHVAQQCNKGGLVYIDSKKDMSLYKYKNEQIDASTLISGEKEKEQEAYALETRPKKVIEVLKTYCL